MKQQNKLIRKKWLNVITVLSLFLGVGLGVFMLPNNALGAANPLTKYKAQQAKLEKQMRPSRLSLPKPKPI